MDALDTLKCGCTFCSTALVSTCDIGVWFPINMFVHLLILLSVN